MARDTKSAPATGGDTGAAKVRTDGGADAATALAQGAAGAPASAALVDGAVGGETGDAGTILHQETSLPETKPDAVAAASVTLLDGRPEDVARAAQAATGSSLDAPSVGSGPAAEMQARADATVRPLPAAAQGGAVLGGVSRTVGTGAGIPPGVFSREGSFGAEPELSRFGEDVPQIRRAFLEGDLRRAPFTGAKLAFPKPDNAQALADYAEAGFDIEVISRQRGFRRAGVVHPTEPTLRRSGDFSTTELQAIVSEPMLTVLALRGPLAGAD